jgi:hypothetical protein
MDKYQQFHFGRAQSHFKNGNTSHALRHLQKCNTRFGAGPVGGADDDETIQEPAEVPDLQVPDLVADTQSLDPPPKWAENKADKASDQYYVKSSTVSAYVKTLAALDGLGLPADLARRMEDFLSDMKNRENETDPS